MCACVGVRLRAKETTIDVWQIDYFLFAFFFVETKQIDICSEPHEAYTSVETGNEEKHISKIEIEKMRDMQNLIENYLLTRLLLSPASLFSLPVQSRLLSGPSPLLAPLPPPALTVPLPLNAIMCSVPIFLFNELINNASRFTERAHTRHPLDDRTEYFNDKFVLFLSFGQYFRFLFLSVDTALRLAM